MTTNPFPQYSIGDREEYSRRNNKQSGSIAGDGLNDKFRGPIGKSMSGNMYTPVRSGMARDGIVFKEEEVRISVVRYLWAERTENALMNLTEELNEQYKAAEKLWDGYKEKMVRFRSEVKNDVVSLEASARKTTEAVHKMNKAYGNVIAQMNGPEMQQAVLNAERLAAAMTALANLQSHKLTVAVIDNDRGTVT